MVWMCEGANFFFNKVGIIVCVGFYGKFMISIVWAGHPFAKQFIS